MSRRTLSIEVLERAARRAQDKLGEPPRTIRTRADMACALVNIRLRDKLTPEILRGVLAGKIDAEP